MPFFLVTHRSLVEADSEQDAAVKALGKIEGDCQLEFEVKFDEATITRVFVERASARPHLSTSGSSTPDHDLETTGQPSSEVVEAREQPCENSSRAAAPERPSAGTAVMVSVFLGGLVLATFLLGAL